jgi:LDH2 family malate/lactate/ureidoglycolate dehydrogenase
MADQQRPRLVTAPALKNFMRRGLAAAGLPDGDAETVAGLMLEADAAGVDGHGILRLPQYVKRIKAGGINTKPDIRILTERAGQALIDGDNGMGHLVMKRAAEIAMEKAAVAGVGWVGARNSNHAGVAALYARMPLKRDMIGIYVAVGSSNHLPPWGGTDMLLSTNPIAIAVPSATRAPIVLDMATTVAAYGKVKIAEQRGEQMPEGWMIGRDGKPLTDPKKSKDGFLLPIGGPKGYGLALMFGLLAGTLNGAAFGRDVIDFNADSKSVTNTGQFVAAIDIAAFMDPEEFKRQVDIVYADLKASPTLPGFDEVRLPGERAAETTTARMAAGIPIYPELDRQLTSLAQDLGIAPL